MRWNNVAMIAGPFRCNWETAASLIATAMKTLPSIDAKQTLERLVAEDGYGTRTPLANDLATLSPKS